MNLYDIIKEIKTLEKIEEENEIVDLETGEITYKESEIIESLKNNIINDFDNKTLGYRNVIIQLQNDIELARKERDRIQRYSNKLNNTINRLKDSLKASFEILNIDKKELENGASISLRNNKIYEYDEDVLPEIYFRIKKEIDKNYAKIDFKNGILKKGIKESEEKNIIIK